MSNYENDLTKTKVYKMLQKLATKHSFTLKRVVRTARKGALGGSDYLIVYECKELENIEVILDTTLYRYNPVYIDNVPFEGSVTSFKDGKKGTFTALEATVLQEFLSIAVKLAEDLEHIYHSKALEQLPILDDTYA